MQIAVSKQYALHRLSHGKWASYSLIRCVVSCGHISSLHLKSKYFEVYNSKVKFYKVVAECCRNGTLGTVYHVTKMRPERIAWKYFVSFRSFRYWWYWYQFITFKLCICREMAALANENLILCKRSITQALYTLLYIFPPRAWVEMYRKWESGNILQVSNIKLFLSNLSLLIHLQEMDFRQEIGFRIICGIYLGARFAM